MNLIVAVDQNWAIGKGGDQLVYISEDLKRFKALTTGHPVILGRKTLATFPGGRPLKGRRNLILSANPAYMVEGAEVVHSIEELKAAISSEEPVSVIGGASIYELLLPYCSEARVTKTLLTVPADRFFPNLDELPNWHITETSDILEENGIRFQYVDYKNDNPLPL